MRPAELPEHTRFGLYPIREPASYQPEVVVYKPDPTCQCGCNKTIEVIELRTYEGEPVYSEECFMRIAYKEGLLIREAV